MNSRHRIQPRITMSRKMSKEMAQKMRVWLGVTGFTRPGSNEPSQNTISAARASTTNANPMVRRLFMIQTLFFDYSCKAMEPPGFGPSAEFRYNENSAEVGLLE